MLNDFQEKLNKYGFDRSPDSVYESFISNKSEWTPPPVINADKKPFGQYETVQRCISLAMALEIPVGELVLDGLDRSDSLPSEALYALLHNAKDEDVHYRAFDVAYEGYKVANTSYDAEMASLVSNMPSTGHPVFMAGYLELGIFMVTLSMLRKFGSDSIERLVMDVSRDESCHVRTNWELVDQHNLGSETPALRAWRRDVMDWLTQDIKLPNWKADKWIKQSDSLIEKRKAPDLEFTRKGMYVAFFESGQDTRSGYSLKA